jgi:serine/threonine-protein kinase
VLYFQDEGGGDSLGYLADGLTEGLIQELDQVQGLDVISKGGVAPYRGDGISRDSVARALKAGTLVTGEVEATGARLRTTVRLVDGASGADFGRTSFEQPAGNLLGVQDTLAQKVSELVRERLGEEIRLREQKNRTRNVAAWALLQRAEQARKQAESLLEKNASAATDQFDVADSLYAEASKADLHWPEPVVARAALAYRRSRLAGFDGIAAKPWIDKGEKLAAAVLALNPQDPDGLEQRGNLRYWKWLLNLEPDPAAAKRLLLDAERDLETTVKLRPSRASAWAMLSHLYNQTKGSTDAKLAARRAYEADAYLSNADQVINRLFLASYDLEQFVDAVHWCEEGARRFPGDFKFAKCQLWSLTTRAMEPDVARAWKLADSLPSLSPANRREIEAREARMIVAMVLARAGLADSARAVARRARAGPDVDPTLDLVWDEIYVHILLGDKDQAIESLKSFLAANPDRRNELGESSNWWFRDIENDPRYKALVGGT